MKSWTDLAYKQPVAVEMLKQMLIRNRTAHAYLIHGDSGAGKEEIGHLLAKSLFCKERVGENPCEKCKDCLRINSGNHPDVHWIKPDGSSIKKEQIAHLQKEFTYTGLESNQKAYLISQADQMTMNAANRLLKFLEEPNRQTTAILMTENSQNILDTIKSRCQVIALKPLSPLIIQQELEASDVIADNARLFAVLTNNLEAAKALDQDEWFAQARKLVVQLISTLQTKQDETLWFIQKQWMDHFSNRDQLEMGLDLLMYWFKDLIYLHIDQQAAIVFRAYLSELEKGRWVWSRKDTTEILYAIMEAKRHIAQNVHPTLVMEQLTLQMQR
ncbi:DNA polymerase III subunit delta' [Amphibacillus cookii]|uniref:DNA polymerase III subunit delta' n=1 Tax=Amphibacillus cookii TaxID=767787 RepID=UPI00195B4216|nr:DNA polymerase III subunit delta' [Amphibacillus cookii]MBM7543138.1 DNA polymerase-3 subunit delta' [Amphibacillus cookii]